jgi:hypothetical protein
MLCTMGAALGSNSIDYVEGRISESQRNPWLADEAVAVLLETISPGSDRLGNAQERFRLTVTYCNHRRNVTTVYHR